MVHVRLFLHSGDGLVNGTQSAYLLASTDTTVDFVQNSSADGFEQNQPRSRVQNLLVCGSITLVLDVGMCRRTLAIGTNSADQGIWGIDVGHSRGVLT